MKCPVCGNAARTLIELFITLNPLKTVCRHCGSDLRLSTSWKRFFWVSLAAAFFAGVLSAIFKQVFLFFAVFIGLGIITDLLFWKFARYELMNPALAESDKAVNG